ncbi:MAG: Trk system potassium transporter TrkA [Clostridia bacterium]|nr:Trk system potassium transporter TrkA [Clostridia bacterium]
MKILIAGIGKVGAILTQKLAAEGHDLTLIDRSAEVVDSCVEYHDVAAVRGNCASMEVLRRAGVEEADLLIAAAGEDEVNLLCCMTAHKLNPRLHTIARIRNPEYSGQVYSMKEAFALSLAVNPERQAAQEIERLLKFPGFLKRDTFAKGRVEIVELEVGEESKLRDMPLSALGGIVKCRVLVCAVLREGRAVTPGGDFVLRAGDRIFVTATTNNLTTLLKNLGMITHRARRVMLAGGGRVSYYLAELLEKSGVAVQIIEQDLARCEELAARLPGTGIIHGDASSQALLESEGLASYDAFVTLTGIDELNMVMSLYGDCLGVPRVITKLGRLESSELVTRLNMGSVVCPKELCCNTIVRYVRAMQNQAGAALSVHTIAEGEVEAIEFAVDDKTKHCGVPLKDLRLRKGVLVVGISHGANTEIAGGDSVFRKGDIVVLVCRAGQHILQLNDIFEH